MTMVSIPISDERVARLRAWADEVGLSPKSSCAGSVDQLLEQPDDQLPSCGQLTSWKRMQSYIGG